MNTQTQRRIHAIEEIRQTLTEAQKQKKDINKRVFLFEIMKRYMVTKRTAKEYLEIAGFEDA